MLVTVLLAALSKSEPMPAVLPGPSNLRVPAETGPVSSLTLTDY